MNRRTLLAATLALSPFAASAADPQKVVVIEAQVFRLGDESFRSLHLPDLTAENGPHVLDAAARAKFLAAVAGKEDVLVVAAPKMTTFDGKPVGVSMQQPYVYNESVSASKTADGTCVMVPKQQSVAVGIRAEFVPQVSADGRTVRLKYEVCDTAVSPKTVKQPFTAMITPVFEGGSQGVPVPFTQFLEKPVLDTNSVQQVVAIPAGSSVLAAVGSKPRERHVVRKVPVVGDLFLIGDLFRWEATEADVEHTFVVLTANPAPAPQAVAAAVMPHAPAGRAFAPPAPPLPAVPVERLGIDFDFAHPLPLPAAVVACETAKPAPAKNEAILKILLEQYDVACKTGDAAKAKTIAAYCLEMDPACFAKR